MNMKLTALKTACKEVLKHKNKAAEVLPTESGFFFGSTNYDEYYFKEVKDTLNIIEPLLAEACQTKEGEYYLPESIYYQSSW
jgi:hypothetical protein